MEPLTASNYLCEALIRATEYTQPSNPTGSISASRPTPIAFTVAISREAGARGTSVARELGQRLGWPVYDHELLEQVARDMHVTADLLERIDERPGSWLLESVQALSAAPNVTEIGYFRRLLKMLLALGARGECIIVGRGAPHVLPVASTLRVRLVGNRSDRVAVIERERGLSAADAARFVDTTDRERARFIRDHLLKDPTDPQNYDLVLNGSRFTVAECAETVLGTLRQFQARSGVRASA